MLSVIKQHCLVVFTELTAIIGMKSNVSIFGTFATIPAGVR